jgi:hypothetical protein
MRVDDIAISSVDKISLFDITTGEYLFDLDELTGATIEQAEDTADVKGKNGRKITTLKRNKTITISGTNGMVSGGMLEQQTGGKFESKVTEVMWSDYLTVSGNAATTTYKAVGTTGAEIEALYVKNADGVLGKEMTQDATAAAGKFAYAPATKKITFNEGELADGTEIVVYYKRRIQANVLENLSSSYSKKCRGYIDITGEDKCGNLYRVQIYVPKMDFSGEFSLEIGDNQTTHGFKAEALAGACGAGGKLWDYTIFGANEADAI